EHRGGAGGHRLLADREVQEPADLAERVRLRRLLLEPADEDHVAQKLAREVGVDPEPRRRLLSHHLGHALPPALYSISLPDITGSPRPSNGLRLALPPHEAEVVHGEAAAQAEDGDDDRQAHR